MIINGENVGEITSKAYYGYAIIIKSKDDSKSISFSFNQKELDLKSIKINETINLMDYINWDTSYQSNDTYYLFDISDNKIILKKINDNEYELEVSINVKESDRIYSPDENYSFSSLYLKTNISFEYEYEREIDPRIKEALKTKANVPDNFFEVLDKIRG